MDISISEVRQMTHTLELAGKVLNEMSDMMPPEEEGDNLDDLGDELDLDQALSDDEDDVIDDFIHELIDCIEQEYEEDSAIAAVEDAVKSLVDDGSIEMIPGTLEPDDVKIRWIWNALPKIKVRLKEFGLEFDETDLGYYETYKA